MGNGFKPFCVGFLLLMFVSTKQFFDKNTFRNNIKVSDSLDPDEVRLYVGPDLGLNRLQSLSTEETNRHRVNLKEGHLLLMFMVKLSMTPRNRFNMRAKTSFVF